MRPDELIDRFGADGVRYFLLREMVFGQDANFSDEAFVDRYNSDLANDLGNTVSRAGDPLPQRLRRQDAARRAAATTSWRRWPRQAVEDYRAAMEDLAFSRALESLWRLLAETNQYIVSREPWKLIKTEGPDPAARRASCGTASRRCGSSPPACSPSCRGWRRRCSPRSASPSRPPASTRCAGAARPRTCRVPAPAPLFPRIDKEAYLGEAQAQSQEKTMKTMDHRRTREEPRRSRSTSSSRPSSRWRPSSPPSRCRSRTS